MSAKALCFVAMPFGKKQDLASGAEIDFDQVYERAIRPAIAAAGLEPLRADEERTGGVIHGPMFERLLLAEFAVVDLTLANPNVFYELGVRHAARPYTTVLLHANLGPLPFDVAPMRAVGYQLTRGALTDDAAAALRQGLQARLDAAVQGVAAKDSPLFQLIPHFPGIDLPHEVTEAFQDRVRHDEAFRATLADARSRGTQAERQEALRQIQAGLGDVKTVQREVLADLLLSYRDVEAWGAMVELCQALPDDLQQNVMVRQQWALALNRRNAPGDRDQAAAMLTKLLHARGPDPETLGILGRVHKDRYREAKKSGSLIAAAALDDAIAAYTQGFEADPRDYYPGVNAVTLLVEKGDPEALREAERLVPLVSFAVARRGGATSSDYWDLATVLELACLGGDWAVAGRVLPRVLAAARAAWVLKTTAGNLMLLQAARERQGAPEPRLGELLGHLEERAAELEGSGREGS